MVMVIFLNFVLKFVLLYLCCFPLAVLLYLLPVWLGESKKKCLPGEQDQEGS